MGVIKNKIYTIIEKKQNKIEKICDKFCTEKQKNDIITSIKDKRNFLPNAITLSRIPGIPLIYASTATGNPILIGTAILLISATDALDGWCARNITKNPNPGGALLDCATDKVFSLALIIPAIIEAPALAINGVLETIIGYINKKATNKGAEQKSTMLGKIKMWPLSITTALIYINTPLNLTILNSAIAIGITSTALLEVVNIVQYKKMAEKNLQILEKQTEIKNIQTIEEPNQEQQKVKTKEKEKENSEQLQELRELRDSLTQEPTKPKTYTHKLY